jgi:hypothetical protein
MVLSFWHWYLAASETFCVLSVILACFWNVLCVLFLIFSRFAIKRVLAQSAIPSSCEERSGHFKSGVLYTLWMQWSETVIRDGRHVFVFNLSCRALDVLIGPPHPKKQPRWAICHGLSHDSLSFQLEEPNELSVMFGSIKREFMCVLRSTDYGKAMSPAWRTTDGPPYRRNLWVYHKYRLFAKEKRVKLQMLVAQNVLLRQLMIFFEDTIVVLFVRMKAFSHFRFFDWLPERPVAAFAKSNFVSMFGGPRSRRFWGLGVWLTLLCPLCDIVFCASQKL